MNALTSGPTPDWNQIRPLLDAALDRFDRIDRDALLLRFFEQRSLAEVGHALGANEDTAGKRVTRALEKLRADLIRRFVTTTAATLSTVIPVKAVQIAPAGLAATLTSASLAGAAAGTGTTLTLLKVMAMTKLKLGIISAVVVAGVATSLVIRYQARVKSSTEENESPERRDSQFSHAAPTDAAQTADEIRGRYPTDRYRTPDEAASAGRSPIRPALDQALISGGSNNPLANAAISGMLEQIKQGRLRELARSPEEQVQRARQREASKKSAK